jgi:hypothetical protein
MEAKFGPSPKSFLSVNAREKNCSALILPATLGCGFMHDADTCLLGLRIRVSNLFKFKQAAEVEFCGDPFKLIYNFQQVSRNIHYMENSRFLDPHLVPPPPFPLIDHRRPCTYGIEKY